MSQIRCNSFLFTYIKPSPRPSFRLCTPPLSHVLHFVLCHCFLKHANSFISTLQNNLLRSTVIRISMFRLVFQNKISNKDIRH